MLVAFPNDVICNFGDVFGGRRIECQEDGMSGGERGKRTGKEYRGRGFGRSERGGAGERRRKEDGGGVGEGRGGEGGGRGRGGGGGGRRERRG